MHALKRSRASIHTISAPCLSVVGFGCLLLLAASQARAETDRSAAAKQAEQQLQQLGLRLIGDTFVLEDESNVNREARSLTSHQKDLRTAKRKVQQAQARVDQHEKLILQYIQKRRELRAQLARNLPPAMHNRAVLMMNELGDRIVMMQESNQEENALRQARSELAKVGDQFAAEVKRIQQSARAMSEKYRQLAGNAKVRDAIKSYNEATGKDCSLGPSRTFEFAVKRLEAFDNMVQRRRIPLRRGGGGLWYVDVVFGEGKTLEMAVDTGASILSIPAVAAARLGLSPDSDSPIMHLQVADGRTVQARRVEAEKVSVGPFTVKNVTCSVLPPEMGSPTPLLGLSFLGNFNFQLDNNAGELIIAAVDLDGELPDDNEASSVAARPDDSAGGATSGGSASGGGPSGGQASMSKAQRIAEIARLLPLPPGDPDAGRTIEFRTPEGKPMKFQPCVRGPAATLRRRFGKPDKVDKATLGKGANSVVWELWTWGPIRVFVDQHGSTRYWTKVDAE